MKIRHIALGIVLSMCAATTSMAANNNTNFNTNTNTNNPSFGGGSFSMVNNGMTITQSFDEDGQMCQYFSFQTDNFFIRQVVMGFNFFQQSFGFGSPPSTEPQDPC